MKAVRLYAAGRWLALRLPERFLLAVAAVAGTVLSRVWSGRRRVVRDNLSRVVCTHLERRVDEAFRSYARYWVEALRLPEPGPAQILARTTVTRPQDMSRWLHSGRGLIFVTAHLGNWDVAGAWVAANSVPLTTVAERLEAPGLYDFFVGLRASAGIQVHPLGSAASVRAVMRTLRDGGVVALVADRDISGTGVWCDFFGEPARIPSGPALLAQRTGAMVVAGACYHDRGNRWKIHACDPIEVGPDDDVDDATRRIARDVEYLVRLAPGQWHLFQPNWPADGR